MSDTLRALLPYIPPFLARTILAAASPQPPHAPSATRIPAAVLFADVSGFTPLAEMLAQRGAEGPEELTRLLNTYFRRIIALLEHEGGEVVKFSGDALTVLFLATDEPLGHAARRALQAATAMQATTQEFTTLVTSAGTVSLSMKIGIGAGVLQTFQVGGSFGSWEYIVAGDPIRQVAQAEHGAGRGEVVLSPEALAVLWPSALAPRPLVLPAETTVTDPSAAITALRGFIPDAVQAWLAADVRDWLAVLRPMSVLFVGINGLDYDRPDALTQVQTFLQSAQTAIATYEGSINKLAVDDKGTVLLVLFGAPPFAHADDQARAVRCARDLQTMAAGQGLQLAIGVASGQVFAGPVGSTTRREYTVIGDVVNLAARLMGVAGSGEIRCDFATVRGAQRMLAFEDLPPVRLKGKAGLVQIYRPVDAAEPVRADMTSFVGRQAEVARLGAVLEAVQAGACRVLLLEGEAGIGKSRLIAQLGELLHERGLIGLSGAGLSTEQQTPYRAWRDIFSAYFNLDGVSDVAEPRRRVQAQVAEVAPELLERLPLLNEVLPLGLPETALTATLDADLRHQSRVGLLVALLRRWAVERPLILVLDDAHWLDSLSWALALAVIRGLMAAHTPLLLLLTLRPFDGDSSPEPLETIATLAQTERLILSALSPDEVVMLVAARLELPAEELPGAVAELVRTRAAGNPFFAEELVLALRDQGAIAVTTEDGLRSCTVRGDLTQAAQTLPDTVQGVVLARIDRLSPEQQLTLRVGAVIGRSFAYHALRATLGTYVRVDDAPLKAQLATLALLDLTPLEVPEPELSYRFKHIITRDVAYSTLLFAQRRQLHGTVAAWYEQTFQANLVSLYPLLVYHYHHAGATEQECHYARLAGAQAAAQFANAEALRYLSRALELIPTDDLAERYRILLLREKVYDVQAARSLQGEDLRALAALAEQLNDDMRRAEVALRRANYAGGTGDYPTAVDAAQQAVALAQGAGVVASEAGGYLAWGRALWQQADYVGASTQLDYALMRSQAAHLPGVEADTLRILGLVAWDQAEYADARAALDQALLLYQAHNDRQGEGKALNNLGLIAWSQDAYAEANSYFEHALRLFREIGDRASESVVLDNLGNVANDQGNYPAARAYYAHALDLYREANDRGGESRCLVNLGTVAHSQGTYAEAQTYYQDALQLCRVIGNRQDESMVLINLGEIALLMGAYTTAQAQFTHSLDLCREIGSRRNEGMARLNLGIVAHTLGQYDRARHAYEQALRLCREIGDRGNESLTLAYLSLHAHHSGDDEAARRYSQQAYRIAQEVGARHKQGLALTRLGRALLGLGHLDESTDAYRQALDLWRALGPPNLATGPLAGLAEVALARGDLTQAQMHVEEILAHLAPGALQSTVELAWVYLTCYRVLKENHDRRASALLDTAYAWLQERAAGIDDADRRRSFLEDIATHRELIAWHTTRATASTHHKNHG
jgi:class 3 adenylate cyclase/tetratricopeptide (TPR) repeat protein